MSILMIRLITTSSESTLIVSSAFFHFWCFKGSRFAIKLFQNGGPTFIAANNLPLRGAKTTLWEGGTKGAAFVYSETLLKKTRYVNTE